MLNLIRFMRNFVTNIYFLLSIGLLTYLLTRSVPRGVIETKKAEQLNPNNPNQGVPRETTKYIQDLSDPFRDFPRVTPHGCVNNSQSFLPDVWTIICVNNPDFNDIGREVFNNGAWEAWLTNHIVKAMLNYPGAVLLDIGSNIGPHSLTVAAMGKEVIVLDAVYYNLALISMSHKMTNKGQVRILYNSISDKPGDQLYPYLEAQHQHMAGATYLVSKESLDAGKYKWEEVIGPPAVSTTTWEIFESIEADTVVIKIDVEGHECKALLPEILDQSTGKFVPYIFMEWANLRLNRHRTCDNYQSFLQSFTDSGYLPHKADPSLLLDTVASHQEWFDVIWIHKDALKIEV